MKQYIYYWHHHNMPEKDRKEIEMALINKNFNKFIELYKIYSTLAIKYGRYDEEFEAWFPLTFLPNTVAVYNTETEEFEEDEYVLSKSSFMKIIDYDCECG